MPDHASHIDQIVASQRAARESRVLLEQAQDLTVSSRRLIESARVQIEASRRAMDAAIRLRDNGETSATERSEHNG